MRKILFVTAALSLFFTSLIWAADISGTWTLKMSGRQGEESMDLVVTAAGEDLTVIAKHPRMGDMAGTGTLKDNAISMNLTSTGERKMGIALNGTVTGTTMSGTREMIRPSGGQSGDTAGRGGDTAGRGGDTAGRPATANTWTAEKQ